jgi:nanoRNase/pAp phosphatase (c-di-AMP/oligoRNAs hydrolase)
MIDRTLQFLEHYQGRRLLYLCHYGADGDAVGSAVALSRVFDGDIGVIHHIRKFGKDLIDKLDISYIVDPDFSAYHAVMMVDMLSSRLLANTPCPPLYGVIDHHRSPEEHDLVPNAHCYYIRCASSTCELVYDLLKYAEIPITQDVAYPLIWGICGDTGIHLGHSHSLEALDKLVNLMRDTNIVPAAFTEFSEPIRSSRFRWSVLNTVREADVVEVDNWIVASAIVEDEDVGLKVYQALNDLGAHVSIVGFICDDRIFIRIMADPEILKHTDLDLKQVRTNLRSRYRVSHGFGGAGRWTFSVPNEQVNLEILLKAFKEEVINVINSG